MRRCIVSLLAFFVIMGVYAAGHPDIHVVILGDSNTSIGGDSCNGEKGWNKWFKERFAPASCISYARSGATWTNTSQTKYNVVENTAKLSKDNVIYNQVNRLVQACEKGEQAKPQLVIIAAGTNDAWFSSARPGVFSKTPSQAFEYQDAFITGKPVSQVLSLAESVRYVCEMLMEHFPDAQIVLLTPLQSVAVGSEGIRKVGDIIERCGQYMGINVIRQDYGCSVYGVQEKVKKTHTYDGTHTDVAGAKKNGYYIANRIEAILQM